VFFDNLIHHLNEENLASLYGSQPEELSINDSSQTILNEMPLPKNGRITTEINHATHHSLIN
jgi:hypothetical protein